MIYPLQDHVRRRVQRRQADDEAGGWDRIEVPPTADILPFHHPRNRFTDRLQPATASPARLIAVPLLMPWILLSHVWIAFLTAVFDPNNLTKGSHDGKKADG